MNNLNSKATVSFGEESQITPLSTEDFKDLLAGEEVKVRMGDQLFFLSMIKEDALSLNPKVLLSDEMWIALGHFSVSLQDGSWQDWDNYGKDLDAFSQVFEQLQSQQDELKIRIDIADLEEKKKKAELEALTAINPNLKLS